jgi:hypothetical protein
MQNRTNPRRRQSHVPVSWPVLYGNGEFLAAGTVLNLTSLGWRVAGTMPVAPGMELTLQVSIPERPTPLSVYRATVLCVNGDEFSIETHEMAPSDHTWVTAFFRQQLGLTRMSRPADQESSLEAREEIPHEKTSPPKPSLPSVEDLLHRIHAIDHTATDLPGDAQRSSDASSQESQAYPIGNCVPEKLLHEAHRILLHMVTLNTARVRTGQSPIPNN